MIVPFIVFIRIQKGMMEMKRKERVEKLMDYVHKTCGKYDCIEQSGNYAFSYNYGLGYVSMFYVHNDGEVLEDFVDGEHNIEDILGKKFFDNALSTQFKKVRKRMNDVFMCVYN